MSDEADHKAIEAVVRQAKSARHAQDTQGFVIVKWMDRYSYYLTSTPQATLEKIVNTQTRAEVVARYACIDGEWVRLPLKASSARNEDGSGEECIDGPE